MGMMDFLKKATTQTVEQRIQARRDKAKQKADAERAVRSKARAEKMAAGQAVAKARAEKMEKARKEKETARAATPPASKPAPATTTPFVSDFVPVIHKKWHERPDLHMPYAGARQVSMDEVNRCPIGAKVRFNKENAEHYISHGANLFHLYVVLRNGGIWTPEVKAAEVPDVLKEMTSDWRTASAPKPALGDLGNPHDVDSRAFDPTVTGGA